MKLKNLQTKPQSSFSSLAIFSPLLIKNLKSDAAKFTPRSVLVIRGFVIIGNLVLKKTHFLLKLYRHRRKRWHTLIKTLSFLHFRT